MVVWAWDCIFAVSGGVAPRTAVDAFVRQIRYPAAGAQ
jgi:hypothetical protein